ncbi:MAG: 30S ribosomal protein S12 methylthiotransferase RimO [Gammaproteobacteria bacterium]|nr:30S ribosomal protein S12 methylthiotransferase RimO [Gammaproteobacteria bacterium]
MTTADTATAQRVGFVSLGCPKALVDSERILTRLRDDGYQIAPDYDSADLVVVNTCGFIDDAKAESIASIGEALDANGRVIVTGCLGATPDEITAIHPQVLHVSGPQQYDEVLTAVHQHLPLPANPFIDLIPAQRQPSAGIKLTPSHYAYIKISEGCNHKCSFCIIPSMRGKLVSRPLGMVMQEAEQLATRGVRELLVISQDTSAYGIDTRYQADWWQQREYQTRLTGLCHALGELHRQTGVWVRLHYVYPYPHVDDIIPLMRDGLILPYLDIPFQHGSRSVLKRMRRPAATENNLERISRWREICPQITLRSTFIVGFPGETDAEFEQLLSFLQAAQLDRVGCFQYSPVAGAAANDLAAAVPDEIKQQRWERFMQTQAEISANKLKAKVGSRQQALVDNVAEAEDGSLVAIARGHADAPEIDGQIIVTDGGQLQPGDRVEVQIDASDDYDLYGHLIDAA